MRAAIASQHFGKVITAYRQAHRPPLAQSVIAGWLGLTQTQVSRMERAEHPPSDLRKLQRWADILNIPPGVLWFGRGSQRSASDVQARPDDSAVTAPTPSGAFAALVTGSNFVADAPWNRLADSLSGSRAADASSVGWIEARTREFFRTEETRPARMLLPSLREHTASTLAAAQATVDDSLRRRLISAAGETQALIGWALFDLDRYDEAEDVYGQALQTARQAGDGPLTACVLGFRSYLASRRGDHREAAAMLAAAGEHVRGSAPTTHAWISARLAEEEALCGETGAALRAIDRAMTAFDLATSGPERSWTCFFTANRLGSLAVSTYACIGHPDTDRLVDTLMSAPTAPDTKVTSLVLADIAMSAVRRRDYDRAQDLAQQSVDLAVRTECNLAVDKLRTLIAMLPPGNGGIVERIRNDLIDQLSGPQTP